MRFAYTSLYVNDVKQSLDFYERAFGFARQMLHEGGDWGELDTGNTTLAFGSRDLQSTLGKEPGAASGNGPVFELAFTTDDVTKAVKQAVNAGAELVKDADVMPWGQTVAYVRDPDGFLIELCTPIVYD